ncbi:hypothetical protein KMP13_11525 [Epibacterium ulvae]|uniref:hypothetical protein n=1 Tax=Epibacterium ulvae TaxID=1156985 RepID=UPI001BFC8B2C|nr:hypothetical protein [Epibacterium ulvae]MBT8154516.1 hypothetical protein [Epibacterium ulvae]
MMATKTLIFHIGDHKTGSTSIQLAFAEGRVALDQKTVFYPAKLTSNALKPPFHAWATAETEAERQKHAPQLTALAQKIRNSSADYVLVSAEEFEGIPAPLFKKVVDHFFANTANEIRVIAYVRPHGPRLVSSFSERTKVGLPQTLTKNLSEFVALRLKNKNSNYHARFSAWRQEFGDAFVLRPMIHSQLQQGSVVTDFIHHAFPDEPYVLHGDDTANVSLDLVDLMRLKVLQRNLQHKDRKLRHRIGWDFSRHVAKMPANPNRQKLQLHRSLAKTLQRTYLEDACAMDRDFFSGAPLLELELRRAVRGARLRAQSVEPATYLSASEIQSLTLMASIFSDMLNNEAVDWSHFFHQKRLDEVDNARARYVSTP